MYVASGFEVDCDFGNHVNFDLHVDGGDAGSAGGQLVGSAERGDDNPVILERFGVVVGRRGEGFVLAAFVVGSLAQRGWDRRVPTTAIAMLMGTGLIFLPGVSWLAVYVGPERAIEAGLLPFLPGAAIKIALATALLPAGWRAMSRLRR